MIDHIHLGPNILGPSIHVCAKRIHSNFEHKVKNVPQHFVSHLQSMVAKLSFISPFSAVL